MQQAHAPNTRHSPASVPRRLSSVVPFTRPSDRNSRDEGTGKNGQFGSPSVSQGRRSSLSERGTTPPLGLSAPPAVTTTTGFTLPEVLPVFQQRGFQTAEHSAADEPLRRSESSALKGALSRELSREAFPANSNSSALKVIVRPPPLTSGTPAFTHGQIRRCWCRLGSQRLESSTWLAFGSQRASLACRSSWKSVWTSPRQPPPRPPRRGTPRMRSCSSR